MNSRRFKLFVKTFFMLYRELSAIIQINVSSLAGMSHKMFFTT